MKKVRCSVCGKSFVPLLRHVNIGKYQTKSNEFEQLVVETVSETSYRRGMEQLARDGRNAHPFKTANGWTLQTDCDEIQLSPEVRGVSGKGFVPCDAAGWRNTEKARPYQKKLVGIMAIELPQDDFQKVAEEDRKSLEGRMAHAKKEVQKLIDELSGKGY